MAIPQAFIDELVARTDVVDVIGRYVQLKKAGANFVGLCPFHGEKSPSFNVSPSRQFFHCFGCGKSGNVIGFLMEFTGAGFVDVVQDLAQRAGLDVPDDRLSAADRVRDAEARERKRGIEDVLERAAAAYRANLKSARAAIAYLKGRGVSGRIARDFGLGWAPEGWHNLASVFGDYSDPTLASAGLVIEREDEAGKRYDRFRGRVMFPIHDMRGKLIGFGGRVLDDGKPKYLNSPEGPVFHKGHELYGLWEARKAVRERGCAIVTEGYMDVVALAQNGFGNAVATLGTACTPEHVKKLFRFTENVVFNFDGDAAGRAAAHKALRVAAPFAIDGRSVRFLFLPPEHDPDSFVRSQGAAAFEAVIDAAVPLSRFLLDAAAEGCDMATPEGRARFGDRARELWQLVPEGALAQQLQAEIAARVQIGLADLQRLWSDQAARSQPLRRRDRVAAPTSARQPAVRRAAAVAAPPMRRGARNASTGRALRALQIVFAAPELWLDLSASDQQLLCGFPAPFGGLFTWLDGHLQEHGPAPWEKLRAALASHPDAAVAERALEHTVTAVALDKADLDAILRAERPDFLKTRMNRALAAGDMEMYRVLLANYTQIKLEARKNEP